LKSGARRLVAAAFLVTAGLTAVPGYGQEADLQRRIRELERQVELLQQQLAAQDSAALEELRRQIDIITRELEEMKLGQELVVEADTGLYGLGPAASKVYRVGQGVSIGGYGEMLYENFAREREDGSSSDKKDQFDFLRGVVYVGYKVDDRFLFNSEIEVEHASTSQAGSVSLELAYLDYLMSEPLGIRAGLLLVPMGFINEMHEPTTFLGTERPATELRIIPTTWRENGAGIFGQVGGFAYRAYAVNGLDGIGDGSSKASGFSAEGLRGGRQKGSKAVAEDFGGAARLDYSGVLGLLVGTSFYAGNSGQGAMSTLDGSTIDALTLIWEGHAQYRAHGLDLRGLFALSRVDDVEKINAAKGLTGDESVGERLVGWYLQVGYDVLHKARTGHRLIPYARYERVNTQDQVPAGFSANPATDLSILAVGAAWQPITSLIVKADYLIQRNAADTGVNQLNLNVGYLF
jgi:hypothetical protein